MPEHEPYDYDGAVDAAFERLHRDIASSSKPPGAADAVTLARHRRRTTFGVVAAVVVLALAGTTTGIAVHRHNTAIGPADGTLPAPAPLTAQALSVATSGWAGAWATPTGDAAIGQVADTQLSNLSCLDSVDSSAVDNSTGVRGGGVFSTSAGQVAYFVGMKLDAKPAVVDAFATSIDSAAAACRATATTTSSYGGGGRVSFYEIPGTSGQGDIQLWTARLDNRIGILATAGGKDAPSTDTVALVDGALMAAMQSDTTFKTDPSLGGGGVSSGTASGSGTSSGSGDNVSFPTLSTAELTQAFGTWESGLKTPGATSMPTLPCVDDTALAAGSSSGASIGTNGLQSTYDFGTAETATQGVATLVSTLGACTSTAYEVTTIDPPGTQPGSSTVTVANSPGAATIWIVRSDHYLSLVGVRGGDSPPESVSLAVGALLQGVLAHPQANPSGATPSPKQRQPAASSSSSAAAPRQ